MDMQQTEVVDSNDEMCEDDARAEDVLSGMEAGRAFAYRHILDKINTFIEVYRREGYSEEFIEGYLDGINDVTGGTISLQAEDAEENSSEEVDNPPDSD